MKSAHLAEQLRDIRSQLADTIGEISPLCLPPERRQRVDEQLARLRRLANLVEGVDET